MATAQLCGSVNLDSAEEVFRTVAEISGDTVKRIPDGETGTRQGWILGLIPQFEAESLLESAPPHVDEYVELPRFRPRDGVDAADLRLDLGYARHVVDSYAVFQALKEEGVLAANVRFQASLPTQIAMVGFFPEEHQPAMAPVLERALADQIAAIAEVVPIDQLAVQWDVAVEVAQIEFSPPESNVQEEVVAELVRLGELVPDGAQLGFHLCYGDALEPGEDRGRHFLQPRDTSVLVGLANAISSGVQRQVDWIHMPVPIDRDDDDYFRPLTGLELQPGAQLFLGLVHDQDGHEGTQRRIDVAARYASGFGVGTECGMGRRPREAVRQLLEIQHAAVVPAA